MAQISYNYHRIIRNTPYNIFFEKGENKQDIIIVPRKFKVNDKVRLRLKKKVFDKSDVLYFSKEVYIVDDIEKDIYGTTQYLLSDGKYYTGKNLIKVNDIIYYEPDDINSEEEKEFIETKKIINLDKNLKKAGVSLENIQEGKREKKKKKFFDE